MQEPSRQSSARYVFLDNDFMRKWIAGSVGELPVRSGERYSLISLSRWGTISGKW